MAASPPQHPSDDPVSISFTDLLLTNYGTLTIQNLPEDMKGVPPDMLLREVVAKEVREKAAAEGGSFKLDVTLSLKPIITIQSTPPKWALKAYEAQNWKKHACRNHFRERHGPISPSTSSHASSS